MEHRLLYTTLTALLICLLFGPSLIAFLRRLKFGQNIRAEGPKSHLGKSGTPTMGGVLIIGAIAISTLIWGHLNLNLLWAVLFTLAFGFIGFLDDYIKTVMKRSLGLRAREKLLGQVILAAALAFYAYQNPTIGPEVFIPFWSVSVNLGIFYIPFVILVVTASTNAVNLTDGLDGLAAGTSAVAFFSYLLVTMALNELGLSIFAAAGVGACIGFLWFNFYPAQVFMGDTGSLALGGALAILAVLTKTEFLLVIIGGVFVLETLSVIIQVMFFRLTGGRIFKMSPLHHHFELCGWPETKVVIRFWILALLFAAIGLQIPFWE